MNRLAQFLQYATKGFKLKGLLRRVSDGRDNPKVPLLPLALCLVLGVVIRIASHLDLAQQTKDRRRWRHLCGLKAPVAHEIFAYATERMNPEDWRQNQALLAKQLKRNKALESAKIKGLLFVSLDANEHFASFSRTCPCCCQRQVEVSASDGQKVKVIQFYHRYVFAHISGPKVNLVLDIEPIRRARRNARRPYGCWAGCAAFTVRASLTASAPMRGMPRGHFCAPSISWVGCGLWCSSGRIWKSMGRPFG